MIFELRQYRIKPGRTEDCHRMFRESVLPVFAEVGITAIGFWEPEHKGEFDLHYIVGFADAEARARAWQDFIAHPRWQAEKAGWTDGPPFEMTKATVMTPTAYSAIR